MNIFIGGSETSSTAIEWAMTELMRNPEAMKKAQDEVRGIVGNKRKIVLESDLDQLHYLNSIIKEIIRLYPPVPMLVQRETMQDCQINGYDVPAKTRLLVNAMAIGRDEDVWERPHEFYPERFINCSIDFRGHNFEFIPFGAGRRICPGMNAGMLVVELGLANLLHNFNWQLPPGLSVENMDMREVPGITVHRKSSLCLVASKFFR